MSLEKKNNPPKKANLTTDWLLNISIVACILSLVVFVYFLVSGSQNGYEANANSYTEDQVIVAINNQRKENNLPDLVKSHQLSEAAQNKAEDMKNRNYFSHVYSKDGTKWSDFIKEVDYNYLVAGENLANGFYEVQSMVQAWIDSPTHRENILNPKVEETGVGIAQGELDGISTIFVVQMFGKKSDSATTLEENDKISFHIQVQAAEVWD